MVRSVLSRPRLEICWWPTEATVGGRYLRLAIILFKMLRSSKAEISASYRKEKNFSLWAAETAYPISSFWLLWLSWPSSNIPWSLFPLDGKASGKLSPPLIPRSTTNSQAHQGWGAVGSARAPRQARAAWGDGPAQPSSSPGASNPCPKRLHQMLCPKDRIRALGDQSWACSSKRAKIVQQERSQICSVSRWVTVQIFECTIVHKLEIWLGARIKLHPGGGISLTCYMGEWVRC